MAVERYSIVDLQVDANTSSVRRAGQLLHLSPLSFALFLSLLRRAPEVVRRQDLIDFR